VYEMDLPSVDDDACEEYSQRDLEYEDGRKVSYFASNHPLTELALGDVCS
jgi:hypothetical protein